MRTPVLFLVFNRPALTAQVFERLRAARPRTLLVVADGPRADRPEDAANVRAVRDLIARGVDWPCDLRTNFSPENLGCRDRVATGITWAFSQVEEAIILEDDCRPDPSFFGFCETLLDRYRDDPRVMHIGGTNFAARHAGPASGYRYSRHAWVWGWATWRRAWQHYDFDMATWDARQRELRASFASGWERDYWLPIYDHARRHAAAVNTWDYAWHFTCRSRGGHAIVPARNLVENLGFGEDHTHTPAALRRLHRPAEAAGPIPPPPHVRPTPHFDELWTRVYRNDPFNLRNDFASWVRTTATSLRR